MTRTIRIGVSALAVVCASAMLFIDGAASVRAETPRSPVPAPRAVSAPPLDCAKAGDAAPPAAIAAAEVELHRLWLNAQTDLFIAFSAKVEKRNPFDLSPPALEPGPIGGMIQARAPRCTILAKDTGDAVLVRFTSPFYRFYEQATGWSRPLRDGLVMEVVVTRVGDGWQARDTKSDEGIIVPDETIRRPSEAELPKLARWTEPVPGCARRERWTGIECARRKR